MENPGVAPSPAPKRRRWKLLLALGSVAFVLVVIGAVGLAWLGVKRYLESPRFLQDLSAGVGMNLKAATVEVKPFPPEVRITGLEGEKSGEKLVSARYLEVHMNPAAALKFVLSVRVLATGVTVVAPRAEAKAEAKKGPVRFALPFFRRLDLDLRAQELRLPMKYLPTTDLELVAGVAPRGADGGVNAAIERLSVLGIRSSGNVEVSSDGQMTVAAEFPAEGSLLSGKISGTLDAAGAFNLDGELKLPNTSIPVPKGAKWPVGGVDVEISGTANLGGGSKFKLRGKEWDADGNWDVNLTAVGIKYKTYEKKPGLTLISRGKFAGTAAEWKLTEMEVTLGRANARVDAHSKAGESLKIKGAVEPFELSEFVPLVAQATALNPKVSGKLGGEVDLTLPAAEGVGPSGNVNAQLESGVLDGAFLKSFLYPDPDKPAPLEAEGSIFFKGVVKASFENGSFREGKGNVSVDATPLAARYADVFQKKVGQELVADFEGAGSGKSVLIKSLRIIGPSGLRLTTRGNIEDLKDYVARLQIIEGRLPLEAAAEFLPEADAATGTVVLSGEMRGSLRSPKQASAKIGMEFRNVAAQTASFAVSRVGGKMEVTAGADDPKLGLKVGPIAGLWAPAPVEGEEVQPIQIQGQGKLSWERAARILDGDVSAKLSAVNLVPWMKERKASDDSGMVGKLSSLLDLRKSKFRASIRSPLIRTTFLDFTDASATVLIGAGGHADAAEIAVEKVAGRTLEGELTLKSRLSVAKGVELTAAGKNISMTELSRVVSKVSGKNLQASFFGRGDVDAQGSVGPAGLSSADVKGTARIRDGGFKFLPLPKRFLDTMRQVPKLGDTLPLEKNTGAVPDQFEKADTKFHLKGEKLDLDVTVVDRFMTMDSKGYVTLGGECDMTGQVVPKASLVGPTVMQYLEGGGVPFSSRGKDWACGFKAELGDLAARVAKAEFRRGKERVIEKVKEEGQKIQDSLKGIFGR